MARHALFTVALVVAAFATAHAQNAKTYTPPRTAWGEPDLQGVYSNKTITPFERPASSPARRARRDEEIAELERRVGDRSADKRDAARAPRPTSRRAYNEFWWDRGNESHDEPVVAAHRSAGRTRAAVDGGRAAARSATSGSSRSSAAAARTAAAPTTDRSQPLRALHHARSARRDVADAPTTTTIASCRARATSRFRSRCSAARASFRPTGGAHVGSELRAVDGRFARPLGGQHARRRDDELHAIKTLYRGSAENLQLVERFTRVDADTIDYRFTVDDPTTFTQPWTVRRFRTCSTDEQMFEYACHEGQLRHGRHSAAARESRRRRRNETKQ